MKHEEAQRASLRAMTNPELMETLARMRRQLADADERCEYKRPSFRARALQDYTDRLVLVEEERARRFEERRLA